MPLTYSWDAARRLVVITGDGEVSLADRVACVRAAVVDPALPPRAGVLVEVCRVTNAPSPDDAPWVALLLTRLRERFGRRVAVLNTRVGHVAVAAMVAASAPGDGVRAFASSAAAEGWLAQGDEPGR